MLPFDCDTSRKHCIAAMHGSGLGHIDVTNSPGGGCILTASRRVAGQWTPTSVRVTLAPHGTSTAVGVYASATPHSIIGLFRPPARVVVRKFLDNLFAVTGGSPKRWVATKGAPPVLAWIVSLSIAGLLVAGGFALLRMTNDSSGGSASQGTQPNVPTTAEIGTEPGQPTPAPERSSPQAEPPPTTSIVVQAITQLGATVELQSQSSSEQLVEVTVDFQARGESLARASTIVRLAPGETRYVDVGPDQPIAADVEYEAVVESVRVL